MNSLLVTDCLYSKISGFDVVGGWFFGVEAAATCGRNFCTFLCVELFAVVQYV